MSVTSVLASLGKVLGDASLSSVGHVADIAAIINTEWPAYLALLFRLPPTQYDAMTAKAATALQTAAIRVGISGGDATASAARSALLVVEVMGGSNTWVQQLLQVYDNLGSKVSRPIILHALFFALFFLLMLDEGVFIIVCWA